MSSISIQVVGDKAVQRKLGQVINSVQDTLLVNYEVASWLLRWVDENFQTQGRLAHRSGWAPLKGGGRWVGKGRRRRFDKTAQILQDTGRLRASFHVGRFATRDTAGVGSNIPYSIYHQLGVPMRNLPERRMLPLPSDRHVTVEVTKIYDAYLARELRT